MVRQAPAELKTLFQHYMYGYLPPRAEKVTAKVEREDRQGLRRQGDQEGSDHLLRPAGDADDPPAAVVPNERKGPAPVFVGMNFCGNHTLVNDPTVRLPTAWMYPTEPGVKDNRATEAGRGTQVDVWALEQSIDRGYAVATFYSGDIDPDRPDVREGIQPHLQQEGRQARAARLGHHRRLGLGHSPGRRLPGAPTRTSTANASPWSAIRAWARRPCWPAAFDERIALAIPHQAGCGGTAPSRGKVGESVKRINTSFPHWFDGTFKEFNDQPERLPFDQNCLVALVAPRPVLFSNAVEDTWANPDGQFEVLQAADPVYRLLEGRRPGREGDAARSAS